MNDVQWTKMQILQLEELLSDADDDPIAKKQLSSRIAYLEDELRTHSHEEGRLFSCDEPSSFRAAVFLYGGGVFDDKGIKPSLAADIIRIYERIYEEQVLFLERLQVVAEGKKRRKRGSPRPSLILTSTPKGSFGLEFEPEIFPTETDSKLYFESMKRIALLVEDLCDTSRNIEKTVENTSPKVLKCMRSFFEVLIKNHTNVRFSFSDTPFRSFSIDDIERANSFLGNSWTEEFLSVNGVFHGARLDSADFDFLVDFQGEITGIVDDATTEEDLVHFNSYTNIRCTEEILKTKFTAFGGVVKTTYVLLALKPIQ